MEDPDVLLGLLILAAHLGVLIWAITNKHAWWALGIFFFPVVGDIAYAIYYFGTREQQEPTPRTGRWNLDIGDVVQNQVPIRIKGTHNWIPRHTRLIVTRLIRKNVLQVKLPSGAHHEAYADHLSLIRRHDAPAEPSPASNTRPARATSKDMAHASGPAYAEELRELATLRDEGVISDQEFTQKKRQLLGLD